MNGPNGPAGRTNSGARPKNWLRAIDAAEVGAGGVPDPERRVDASTTKPFPTHSAWSGGSRRELGVDVGAGAGGALVEVVQAVEAVAGRRVDHRQRCAGRGTWDDGHPCRADRVRDLLVQLGLGLLGVGLGLVERRPSRSPAVRPTWAVPIRVTFWVDWCPSDFGPLAATGPTAPASRTRLAPRARSLAAARRLDRRAWTGPDIRGAPKLRTGRCTEAAASRIPRNAVGRSMSECGASCRPEVDLRYSGVRPVAQPRVPLRLPPPAPGEERSAVASAEPRMTRPSPTPIAIVKVSWSTSTPSTAATAGFT